MARRKKPEEHANHERWLVSYADFITLLFAFFVVMFAISQVDERKLGRFTESVHAAMEWSVLMDGAGARSPLGDHGQPTSSASAAPVHGPSGNGGWTMARLSEALRRSLHDAVVSRRIQLVRANRDLVVRLGESSFFDPGSATLRREAQADLRRIGRLLLRFPNDVRIEGHTDSAPLRSTRFRSNWELSAARAAAVLDFLTTELSFPEGRLSIAGYADRRPIVGNDTEDGRRQNRRVDLVVLDR